MSDPSQAVVTVTDDGVLYVSAGSALFEIDLATLQQRYVWQVTDDVTGIGLSAPGDELRVAHRGGITLIDRASRAETGVLSVPGRGSVALLGPPRGSVTEFPLECAC